MRPVRSVKSGTQGFPELCQTPEDSTMAIMMDSCPVNVERSLVCACGRYVSESQDCNQGSCRADARDAWPNGEVGIGSTKASGRARDIQGECDAKWFGERCRANRCAWNRARSAPYRRCYFPFSDLQISISRLVRGIKEQGRPSIAAVPREQEKTMGT